MEPCSLRALGGLWGREVGALLFQPLTHCLWGGNGAANSVLLSSTRCRAEGEPITETHSLPLSLTYLQQEQIVPTINIPNLLRASGAGAERISYRPVLLGRAAPDCNATRPENNFSFCFFGIFTFGTAERSQTSCPFCRPSGLRRSKWRAFARCCSREETWRDSGASCGLCPLATTSTRTKVS